MCAHTIVALSLTGRVAAEEQLQEHSAVLEEGVGNPQARTNGHEHAGSGILPTILKESGLWGVRALGGMGVSTPLLLSLHSAQFPSGRTPKQYTTVGRTGATAGRADAQEQNQRGETDATDASPRSSSAASRVRIQMPGSAFIRFRTHGVDVASAETNTALY